MTWISILMRYGVRVVTMCVFMYWNYELNIVCDSVTQY